MAPRFLLSLFRACHLGVPVVLSCAIYTPIFYCVKTTSDGNLKWNLDINGDRNR